MLDYEYEYEYDPPSFPDEEAEWAAQQEKDKEEAER